MTPYDITPADIAACESERLLRLWHQRFYDEKDRLTSQHNAMIKVEYASKDWRKMMGEKIAQCSIAMKRIERRAIELGLAPILTRRSGQRAVIRELMDRVAELEEELNAERGKLRAA